MNSLKDLTTCELQEIQQFFVDYMINDTLGAISTAHLVHADRDPEKSPESKMSTIGSPDGRRLCKDWGTSRDAPGS